MSENFLKEGHIRKLPNGQYRVLSKKNKNLGTYPSKSQAEKRLQQVEYFKHKDQAAADSVNYVIDLTQADEFSYSAIMRCLRKQCDKEQIIYFLKVFKKYFDTAVKEKLQKPERVALQKSVLKLSKLYHVKLSKEIVKNAAISELGESNLVGKYLADIIKFTLNKLPLEKRSFILNKIKDKIYHLNEQEIASKQMPMTASIGQAITFVKHILFNHDAVYTREVLNSIVRNLS